MRVLWVLQEKISISEKLVASGGWIVGALRGLVSRDDIDMHYAYTSAEKMDFIEDKVHFWSVAPLNGDKYPQNTENAIFDLINKINPDVIHCWGTENPITLATVRAAERANRIDIVVINMQGILSYWGEGLHDWICSERLKKSFVPIEIFTGAGLKRMDKSFQKRTVFELEAVSKVKHIIGRTDMDRTFVSQHASQAAYHFCNETLRDTFYSEDKWSLDKVKRHSIFMSEVHYPIKSVEKMFHALSILVKKYEDVQLYIAGQDMFCESKLGKNPWDMIPAWLKRDGYQRFLYKKALELGIKDHVHFIGRQDANGMKDNYLRANVYVSSSIIENESNSLSEAKLLGVPSVSSFVGGVVSRINDGEDGFLYPWNEPWQLANRISQIFDDDELAKKFSVNGIEMMSKIVDCDTNLNRMVKIYKEIAG